MRFAACDLCGAADPDFLMAPARLDGPLVRCRRCGLVYVGQRIQDYTFAGFNPDKSRALTARVQALGLVDETVEHAEGPWRQKLFEDRLHRLQRFATGGKLLEVGCAEGEFLRAAAAAGFDVTGVEPDPHTSARARDVYGLDVTTGTLPQAEYSPASFDVAVLFHVLEHLDSPHQMVTELYCLLKPGGLLVIETPNIDTVWFRLLGRRWRQFIPDHYYFFTPHTLRRLLQGAGFHMLQVKRVGKPMSVRFLVDRVRRFNSGLGKLLSDVVRRFDLEERTLHLNLGDVMLVFARKMAFRSQPVRSDDFSRGAQKND